MLTVKYSNETVLHRESLETPETCKHVYFFITTFRLYARCHGVFKPHPTILLSSKNHTGVREKGTLKITTMQYKKQ